MGDSADDMEIYTGMMEDWDWDWEREIEDRKRRSGERARERIKRLVDSVNRRKSGNNAVNHKGDLK